MPSSGLPTCRAHRRPAAANLSGLCSPWSAQDTLHITHDVEGNRRVCARQTNTCGCDPRTRPDLPPGHQAQADQAGAPCRHRPTGLSASPGHEPSRTWGDSTPQRYVVEGGIKVVPHDRCPRCWQVGDFKLQNPTCSHCGLTMGEQCKLLLDSDECLRCNEGKVTVAKPRCGKCGHEVDR